MVITIFMIPIIRCDNIRCLENEKHFVLFHYNNCNIGRWTHRHKMFCHFFFYCCLFVEQDPTDHYVSKHRKMFRQILKATGNTPIHRILMQMHDIKYIYCHFCRKQGRRLQGQAQGIKMTNNK